MTSPEEDPVPFWRIVRSEARDMFPRDREGWAAGLAILFVLTVPPVAATGVIVIVVNNWP